MEQSADNTHSTRPCQLFDISLSALFLVLLDHYHYLYHNLLLLCLAPNLPIASSDLLLIIFPGGVPPSPSSLEARSWSGEFRFRFRPHLTG